MNHQLYVVTRRGVLAPGDQNVSVFRFLCIASSKEEAIAKAKDDASHSHPDCVWSARALEEPAVYNIGCYREEATPQERVDRKRRQKENKP